jgi:hypothetical protein
MRKELITIQDSLGTSDFLHFMIADAPLRGKVVLVTTSRKANPEDAIRDYSFLYLNRDKVEALQEALAEALSQMEAD